MQEGGFYSAEDADSYPTDTATEKVEGAFCVWTDTEVRDILTENVPGHVGVTEADVVCHHYDIRDDGNVTPDQVWTIYVLNYLNIKPIHVEFMKLDNRNLAIHLRS